MHDITVDPSRLNPRLKNRYKENFRKTQSREQVEPWRLWDNEQRAIAEAPAWQSKLWKDFELFRLKICKHKTYPHHRSWSLELNTGEDTRYLRGIGGKDTLVLAPRGSSKSTYLAEWVAFQIGVHAAPWNKIALRILYISYEMTTACGKSRQVQEILMTRGYQKLFPWVKPSKKKWGEREWAIDFEHAELPTTEEQYTVACAGLMGAINSKRCLTGDSLVLTEKGNIPIKELRDCIGLKVATFNHVLQLIEYKPIEAFAERVTESVADDVIYEITTSSGSTVRCTASHPFFVADSNSYIPACRLKQGDGIIGISSTRDTENAEKIDRCISRQLLSLPEVAHSSVVQAKKRALQELVLQPRLHGSASAKAEILQEVRCNDIDINKEEQSEGWQIMPVLRKSNKKSEEIAPNQLQFLPKDISAEISYGCRVFNGVQECPSLITDEGRGEQQLQGEQLLQQGVSASKKHSDAKGSEYVPNVWSHGNNQLVWKTWQHDEPSGTSFESRSPRQSAREFDNLVQVLPRNSPQDGQHKQKREEIASIEVIGVEPTLVYDIEVEDNHNFYANGVLVHNSSLIICDDLIKSPDDIRSENVREKMISNWQTVIRFTRYDGSRAICLGTRMTGNDIYCTTFVEPKWRLIEQSAILVNDRGEEYSYWEPEGDGEPGQPLTMLQSEREEDFVTFSYQRQNKIVRLATQSIDPRLIIRSPIPSQFDSLVMGVDLSAGLSEKNDFTAMVMAGRYSDGDRVRYHIVDAWQGRIMSNISKLEKMTEMWDRWRHLLPHTEIFSIAKDNWESVPIASFEVYFDSSAYGLSFKGDYEDYIVGMKKIYNWIVRAVPASGRGGKLERLRKHTGVFHNGLISFNVYGRSLSDGSKPIGKLIEQITTYDGHGRDDLLDAFELAVTGLRGSQPLSIVHYAEMVINNAG